MAGSLDFWFFVGSTYTYLTVARIDELAGEAGIAVRWRPFDLRPILRDAGLPQGPFKPFPIKTAHMWRDLERRAEKFGIAYRKPPRYPVEPDLLATRVAIVGFQEGWGKAFTKAAFVDNFVAGKVLGTEENVRAELAGLGLPVDDVLRRARAPEIEQTLARETEEIRALGAFGSPHFVIDGELFWGDDRLEDAIAWAKR